MRQACEIQHSSWASAEALSGFGATSRPAVQSTTLSAFQHIHFEFIRGQGWAGVHFSPQTPNHKKKTPRSTNATKNRTKSKIISHHKPNSQNPLCAPQQGGVRGTPLGATAGFLGWVPGRLRILPCIKPVFLRGGPLGSGPTYRAQVLCPLSLQQLPLGQERGGAKGARIKFGHSALHQQQGAQIPHAQGVATKSRTPNKSRHWALGAVFALHSKPGKIWH